MCIHNFSLSCYACVRARAHSYASVIMNSSHIASYVHTHIFVIMQRKCSYHYQIATFIQIQNHLFRIGNIHSGSVSNCSVIFSSLFSLSICIHAQFYMYFECLSHNCRRKNLKICRNCNTQNHNQKTVETISIRVVFVLYLQIWPFARR